MQANQRMYEQSPEVWESKFIKSVPKDKLRYCNKCGNSFEDGWMADIYNTKKEMDLQRELNLCAVCFFKR